MGENGEKSKEQHVSIIVWMVHRDCKTMRKISGSGTDM